MNDIDTLNPCALSDLEIWPRMSRALNAATNVAGVMFLVSFLVYVAMHLI